MVYKVPVHFDNLWAPAFLSGTGCVIYLLIYLLSSQVPCSTSFGSQLFKSGRNPRSGSCAIVGSEKYDFERLKDMAINRTKNFGDQVRLIRMLINL
jgi:hypothetical protein